MSYRLIFAMAGMTLAGLEWKIFVLSSFERKPKPSITGTRSSLVRPVSGRIVNTTSGTGMFGNVGQSAYAAAKAGIIGITLSIAMELRRYGVTVNAVSPIARTRMTAGLVPDAPADGFDDLDPANASPVVAFLSSAEAGWLTGQVFRVEGSKLVRMRGWQPSGAYGSRSGGQLTADELVDGAAALYGTMPAGVNTLNG